MDTDCIGDCSADGWGQGFVLIVSVFVSSGCKKMTLRTERISGHLGPRCHQVPECMSDGILAHHKLQGTRTFCFATGMNLSDQVPKDWLRRDRFVWSRPICARPRIAGQMAAQPPSENRSSVARRLCESSAAGRILSLLH